MGSHGPLGPGKVREPDAQARLDKRKESVESQTRVLQGTSKRLNPKRKWRATLGLRTKAQAQGEGGKQAASGKTQTAKLRSSKILEEATSKGFRGRDWEEEAPPFSSWRRSDAAPVMRMASLSHVWAAVTC